MTLIATMFFSFGCGMDVNDERPSPWPFVGAVTCAILTVGFLIHVN